MESPDSSAASSAGDEELRQKAQAVLEHLQRELESGDPQNLHRFWEEDKSALHRYIKATEGDVAKSAAMILHTAKWRSEIGLNDNKLSAQSLDFHFKQRKNYLLPRRDKAGRPLFVLRCGRDIADDAAGKLNVMIYQMERAQRILHLDEAAENHQCAWLVDCGGFPTHLMGPSHIKMAKDLIATLNDHFPERLGNLYVIRAPWIFRSFYAMVRPWISAATAEKVKMISKLSDLQQYIDPEILEEEFGGTLVFDYDHDVEFPKMVALEEAWANRHSKK